MTKGGEKTMGDSLKRKRRLWVLIWCVCCAGAASAMLWAVQRTAPVCRQSDLETTSFVSAQALAEEDEEKRVFLTPEGRDFAADSLRELYAMEDRAVAAVGPERFREMVEANRAFTEAFAREVRNGTRK